MINDNIFNKYLISVYWLKKLYNYNERVKSSVLSQTGLDLDHNYWFYGLFGNYLHLLKL